LLDQELPEVVVVNADLATITTEADKILRVEANEPWIVHVEFETSYKPETPLKSQRYNILARYRHGLPVQSIIVLMRPAADGPRITGLLEDHLPDGTRYHEFRYNVVRVWELPAAEILARDVYLLPLAPVSRVDDSELPDLIRRMDERIERELTPSEAPEIWSATYLLMGLVHKDTFVKALLQGVRHMQESSTYQAILREGREEGIQQGIERGIEQGIERGVERGKTEEASKLLLKTGNKRFGPPDPRIVAIIESITELNRLEDLFLRILDVGGWDELFAE
jgi:predicted transposase YdaD